MKEKLEQSKPQLVIEKKEVYEQGCVVGSHETKYENTKIIEEIWRDKKGQETENVKYERDAAGRIISETWVKNGKLKGKYLYAYDDGRFLGKIWE